MNVSLTPELERLVKDKVETGRYASSSEVIREALRLLEARDREEFEKLEALRRDIQAGLDSGPAQPFDAADLKRRVHEKSGRR